jgi:hypothetical protein
VHRPEVGEPGGGRKVVDDQRGGRLTDEDLPALRHAPQPRHSVDDRSEVVAVPLDRFARVQGEPDAELRGRRPSFAADRGLRLMSGSDRVAGAGEHRERRVAFATRLDHVAVVRLDGRGDDLAVPLDRPVHRRRRVLPLPRRPDDVRQQERDDPGRQRLVPTHGPMIALIQLSDQGPHTPTAPVATILRPADGGMPTCPRPRSNSTP